MAIWRKKGDKKIKIDPSQSKKPLRGVNEPKKEGGLTKSLLFGGGREDNPTYLVTTTPTTEAVGNEIIRIDEEIWDRLGIQSRTQLEADPKLSIQYQRLVANSNIPKMLFTPDVLYKDIMEYVFVKYERHLTKPMATKIAMDINRQRLIFEGQLFTGKIGDDQLTKKALEKVTAYCKKRNMSYEHSNEMGNRTRMLTKQVENIIGNEIGSLVTKEESIGTAEMIAKTITKLCTVLNTPVEDVGGLIQRPMRKK